VTELAWKNTVFHNTEQALNLDVKHILHGADQNIASYARSEHCMLPAEQLPGWHIMPCASPLAWHGQCCQLLVDPRLWNMVAQLPAQWHERTSFKHHHCCRCWGKPLLLLLLQMLPALCITYVTKKYYGSGGCSSTSKYYTRMCP
jgi:hypothetical protein